MQRITCLSEEGIVMKTCMFAFAVFCFSIGISEAATQPPRVEKGNIVTEDIPPIPARIKDRLLQYQNTRSAFLQGWLPSGDGILISTRFGETNQIHLVRQPGGARRQITFYSEPIGEAAVSPRKVIDGFLFLKDVGGSEDYQIYFFDMQTGKARMMTDGQSRNGAPLWSNNGDRFAYFTTKRNGRDWDVYVSSLSDPGSAKPALEETGVWAPMDWSPDDSKLLISKYVSIAESQPYILDVKTKELTPFNPSSDKVRYGHALFSKDSKGVYFTSNQHSEFLQLQYYNLATGKISNLTGDLPWDVEGLALSDDGRFLAYTANEDGISRLHVLKTASRKEISLPDLPVGMISGMKYSPDSKYLGMYLNTPQTPGDVFSIDLTSKELVRWTTSETGGLKSKDFIAPTLIHYPTFDTIESKPRMIPSFYYKPRKTGPFPVLIKIHGGPEGQAKPFFNPQTQYILNELGIAVLVPNVRGSAGYGKSYLQLDNGYKREDTISDIGRLLDWIDRQPELDGNRVALIGGSYGGYMVLASMTHFNHRLKGGIEIVGISNFVTFLKNTRDYRRDLRRQEYGDERDPKMRKFLERISPTSNARKITKPILVAQGYNDPRVPVTESEQMVKVIRENGGKVWYILAKNEGHGFSKKTNRDYYNSAVMLFLEKVLLSGKTVEDRTGD